MLLLAVVAAVVEVLGPEESLSEESAAVSLTVEEVVSDEVVEEVVVDDIFLVFVVRVLCRMQRVSSSESEALAMTVLEINEVERMIDKMLLRFILTMFQILTSFILDIKHNQSEPTAF